jgi:uncharacterized membrane protein
VTATDHGVPVRARLASLYRLPPIVLIIVFGFVLVVSGVYVDYLTPVAGLVGVLGVPVYIVLTTTDWRSAYWRERVVLSVAAGIVLVLVVGLAANLLLPFVGVARPLDRAPVLYSSSVAWVLLWWRRRSRWSPLLPVLRAVTVSRYDVSVTVLSLAAVLTSIIGANRLNNGAGSAAAALALVFVVEAFAVTLLRRRRLASGTTALVVYAAGLALLFQTSLRGWFVTGHDIQHEYYVFQQTAAVGHWSFANVHDAYNACLSITVLPTMILRFTGVDGPYVYKVFFQLLFAFSAVTAYAIAARLLSQGLALVAAIFFVAFPTFFTDMAFLNRQEIAFLLTGCCYLLFLIDDLPVHRRRTWMAVLVSGTIATHYSTSYLLLGVLAVAKFLDVVVRRQKERGRVRVPRSPVSIVVLVTTGLLCFWWGSGSAQSNRHLADTLGGVVAALGGSAGNSRAAGASYSLIGVKNPSQQQLLDSYVRSTLPAAASARAAAEQVVRAYPPRLAPATNLPTTALGRKLESLGVEVSVLNNTVRSLSARLLQVLVLAGLVGSLVLRRYRSAVPAEFYFLAVASVLSVGAQVALPVISEDYGLLRAFQQALLVLAPFVTIGSVWLAGVLGRRLASVASGALSLVLLSSLTGLMPQVLGGYPAQLTLNNSGQYYNLFYSSPQEVAAARWLAAHAPAGATVASNSALAEALANYVNLGYAGDIFPTLLVDHGPFVFLGYAEVHLGQAVVTESGNFLTYNYPIQFLDTSLNLVYASPDDRIYL